MTKEATPEQVVEFMTNTMKSTPEQIITMLRAEVERLQLKLRETDRQLTGLEHLNAQEKLALRAEIERLKHKP